MIRCKRNKIERNAMKSIKKSVIIFVMVLFSTNIVYLKEPDWLVRIKSIKPLVSTRDDVIKMFGEPSDKDRISYGEHYDFKDRRMEIIYETGLCVTKIEDGIPKVYGWNVPEWTVIDVSFTPKKRINPKKLNINFDEFKKEEVWDVPGSFEYLNNELGIYANIYKGKLETISFYPAKKYDDLYCM